MRLPRVFGASIRGRPPFVFEAKMLCWGSGPGWRVVCTVLGVQYRCSFLLLFFTLRPFCCWCQPLNGLANHGIGASAKSWGGHAGCRVGPVRTPRRLGRPRHLCVCVCVCVVFIASCVSGNTLLRELRGGKYGDSSNTPFCVETFSCVRKKNSFQIRIGG